MAIEPKNHYWVYQLTITDDQLQEYEMMINSGKAEYVAGELMGRLKSNSKIFLNKDSTEE